MSNLSTLPKGDSAWLLRKAIERIMEQVSVLETNIGSSTTGNSANTQIIFNDNGTLRGDAGLVYNKTTDTLTAGAATITGAATVGTTLGVTGVSTLTGNAFANGSYTVVAGTPGAFANAALTINNRSGVGDLSLIALGYRPNGTVLNSAAYIGYIGTSGAGNGLGDLIFGTRNVTTDTAPTERYRIDSTGIATWQNVGGVAGTAMTLNSTGLGIGTATIPFKLTVASPGSSNTMCLVNTSSNVSRLVFGTFTVPGDSWTAIEGDARATGYFAIRTNDTERLKVDSTGNVNISTGNVVMSTSGKGIDFSATASGTGTMTSELLNDYEEGTFTATLNGSVSDPATLITTVGRYTKVGREVTVEINFSNITTTGYSGRITIAGLPFAQNGNNEIASIVGLYGIATFTGSPFGLTTQSATTISMWSSISNGAFQAVNFNAGSGQYLWSSLTYTV